MWAYKLFFSLGNPLRSVLGQIWRLELMLLNNLHEICWLGHTCKEGYHNFIHKQNFGSTLNLDNLFLIEITSYYGHWVDWAWGCSPLNQDYLMVIIEYVQLVPQGNLWCRLHKTYTYIVYSPLPQCGGMESNYSNHFDNNISFLKNMLQNP